MLLRNALLRDTTHMDCLSLPQLQDARTEAVWVPNHRVADFLVGASVRYNQIASIHLHDVVAAASSVEGESDTAVLTVAVAVAITGVEESLIHILAVERNQTETVADEFVSEHRGIVEDLDHVDGESGDLREHNPAKGICSCKIKVLNEEVGACGVGL